MTHSFPTTPSSYLPPLCSTHSTSSGVSMQLAIHLPSGRRQSSRDRQSVDLWKTSGTPCEEVGSLPSVPARCRCRSQPALGLSAPANLPKCSATAGELRAHALSSRLAVSRVRNECVRQISYHR